VLVIVQGDHDLVTIESQDNPHPNSNYKCTGIHLNSNVNLSR
jgi:hypothetical protein